MAAARRTTADNSRHLWLALCALAAGAFVLLAYVLWSALPAIAFAGDTFCVRGDKIILQSFVTQMG